MDLLELSKNNVKSNILKRKIESGVDCNFHEITGDSALLWACYRGNYENVKLLLHYKADINHIGLDKRNALSNAIRCFSADISYLKIITLLLKKGVIVHNKDDLGFPFATLLYYGTDKYNYDRYYEIIKIIIQKLPTYLNDNHYYELKRSVSQIFNRKEYDIINLIIKHYRNYKLLSETQYEILNSYLGTKFLKENNILCEYINPNDLFIFIYQYLEIDV